MKKILKYIILAIVLVIAVWFSFYTEPLSQELEQEALKEYKPEQLVEHYWSTELTNTETNALTVSDFLNGLRTNHEQLKADHGRVLGIGSNTFYVVKGDADEPLFEENEFRFKCEGVEIHIPAKYIFGNVARDASGWFNIDDFQNTTDFNAVSACMNQRIREQVIADKPDHAADYHHCHFCGAVEVTPDQVNAEALTVYPYILNFE